MSTPVFTWIRITDESLVFAIVYEWIWHRKQPIYNSKYLSYSLVMIICSEKGLTTNEEKTTETLTHYFAKMFSRITQQQMPEPMPIPLSEPFT